MADVTSSPEGPPVDHIFRLMQDLSSHDWRRIKAVADTKTFQYDIVGELPIELVVIIFREYLPLAQAFSCQRVSTRWRHVLDSSILLKQIVRPWCYVEDIVDDRQLIRQRAGALTALSQGRSFHQANLDVKLDWHYLKGGELFQSSRRWDFCGDTLAFVAQTQPDKVKTLNFRTGRTSLIATEGLKHICCLVMTSHVVAFTTYGGYCYAADLQAGTISSLRLPSANSDMLQGRGRYLVVCSDVKRLRHSSSGSINMTVVLWNTLTMKTKYFEAIVADRPGSKDHEYDHKLLLQPIVAEDGTSVTFFCLSWTSEAEEFDIPQGNWSMTAMTFSDVGDVLWHSVFEVDYGSEYQLSDMYRFLPSHFHPTPCSQEGQYALMYLAHDTDWDFHVTERHILVFHENERAFEMKTFEMASSLWEAQGPHFEQWTLWKDIIYTLSDVSAQVDRENKLKYDYLPSISSQVQERRELPMVLSVAALDMTRPVQDRRGISRYMHAKSLPQDPMYNLDNSDEFLDQEASDMLCNGRYLITHYRDTLSVRCYEPYMALAIGHGFTYVEPRQPTYAKVDSSVGIPSPEAEEDDEYEFARVS